MNQKNALLIIDPQNDFCSSKGSLFVPGSEEDNQRLSQFILNNINEIDKIFITLDSHQPMDIAHPSWFQDKDGNNVPPFTVVTSSQVESGEWTSMFWPKETLSYLKELETQGEFVHFIWPEHCITGTWGHEIDETLMNAIISWQREGNFVKFITKGTDPRTEHFGAFQAQVPMDDNPDTQFNFKISEALNKYDNVYFGGQAKSHCVATTLKQVMSMAPDVANKFVILEDAMSPVAGGPGGATATPTFDELAEPIYDDAKKNGVRFSDTTEKIGQRSAATAIV